MNVYYHYICGHLTKLFPNYLHYPETTILCLNNRLSTNIWTGLVSIQGAVCEVLLQGDPRTRRWQWRHKVASLSRDEEGLQGGVWFPLPTHLWRVQLHPKVYVHLATLLFLPVKRSSVMINVNITGIWIKFLITGDTWHKYVTSGHYKLPWSEPDEYEVLSLHLL
jgi:hypothetical protein